MRFHLKSDHLTRTILPLTALAGSFITLFYVFYIMQGLSYSYGAASGMASMINTYNLTVSRHVLEAISSAATIKILLKITDILLFVGISSFAMSVLWLFTKTYEKIARTILVFNSSIFLLLSIILQLESVISAGISLLWLLYLGSALPLGAGIYGILFIRRQKRSRGAAIIPIDPSKPYTNMLTISNRMMRKLAGDIKILDMHFDERSLNNLIRLITSSKGQYNSLSIVTGSERIDAKFKRLCNDFKNELKNDKINFELRIMTDDDFNSQHERMILDDLTAYKIPPLNIINKKSEHIVKIKYTSARGRFDKLWGRATKFENI